jgi:lipase maturation factor 1
LFLRLFGLTYLLAFWSLYTQIPGLIGHDGILPAAQYMDRATPFVATEHVGLDRFRLLPTLCWLSAGDGFLRALCLAGAALVSLLIAGILPAVMVPLLWITTCRCRLSPASFFRTSETRCCSRRAPWRSS